MPTTTFDWTQDESPDDKVVVRLELDYSCAGYDPGNRYGPADSYVAPSGGGVESLKATVLSATHYIKQGPGVPPIIRSCKDTEELGEAAVEAILAEFYASGTAQDEAVEACLVDSIG